MTATATAALAATSLAVASGFPVGSTVPATVLGYNNPKKTAETGAEVFTFHEGYVGTELNQNPLAVALGLTSELPDGFDEALSRVGIDPAHLFYGVIRLENADNILEDTSDATTIPGNVGVRGSRLSGPPTEAWVAAWGHGNIGPSIDGIDQANFVRII